MEHVSVAQDSRVPCVIKYVLLMAKTVLLHVNVITVVHVTQKLAYVSVLEDGWETSVLYPVHLTITVKTVNILVIVTTEEHVTL